MRRDLLQSLADALLAIPKEDYGNFDMDVWMCGVHPLKTPADLHCGTVACAIGIASTLPDWRAAGLRMIKGDDFRNRLRWCPQFRAESGEFVSGHVFLGITWEQFRDLFFIGWKRKPDEVARDILRFLEQ